MLTIEQTLLQRQDERYRLHSIYHNVVNYCSLGETHFISIINQTICMGPSRIQIDKMIDFKKQQDTFPQYLCINDIVAGLLKQDVVLWKPLKPLHIQPLASYDEVFHTLQTICDQEKAKLFPLDRFHTCMFEMIEHAFYCLNQEEKANHLSKIIGMGPGLTPLGDDMVCGYLLCRNVLAYDEQFNQEVKAYAKHKTTTFSYHFIEYACEESYTQDLYTFAHQVLCDRRIDQSSVEAILSFGSSSGFGILYGFMKYLSIYVKRMEKL